jgi:Flp pilus assembly pilin Flp
MLRKLMKNKKAQNTAEYAILISLVVAGIIAMQTYAQRALQARVRDAAVYLKNTTSGLGNSVQYEPYYLTTNYDISRNETSGEYLGKNLQRKTMDSTRNRAIGGFQEQEYDTAVAGLSSGL